MVARSRDQMRVQTQLTLLLRRAAGSGPSSTSASLLEVLPWSEADAKMSPSVQPPAALGCSSSARLATCRLAV